MGFLRDSGRYSKGEPAGMTAHPSLFQLWKDRVKYLPRYGRLLAAGSGLPLTNNEAALNALTNRHRGKRAVVIGMGPSLRVEDLERLSEVVTFGCNKLYLAFEQTEWRPTYYSVTDVLVAENNQQEILETDLKASIPLHSRTVYPQLEKQKGALFYDYRNSLSSPAARMPTRIGGGVMTEGYSVCVEMVQLAYAMGCSEVYLIGVDFSFHVPERRSGEHSVSGEVLESEGEINHFHPGYRKKGETWTVPRMEEQREAFSVCKTLFEQDGRRLLNASRSTKLDVLECVDFDEIFP